MVEPLVDLAKNLSKFEKRRSGLKGCVTKLLKKGDEIIDDEDELDGERLDIIIKKLNEYHQTIDDLNSKILDMLHEDSYDDEIQNSIDYHDKLLDRMFLYSGKLKAISQVPGPLNNDKSGIYQGGEHQACVKLPKLEIAKFNGDTIQWQEFWDSFDTTINQHPGLSAIDKFKYLKGYLEGDALKIADGYRLTIANYSEVVDNLKQRYGNPETAIFAHFESLIGMPAATTYNVSELQRIFDECEKHIRSLVALGIEETTFGRVFTPIILSKIPKFIRMELHRRNGLEPWTLANLRDYLKTEIQVRVMSQHSFGGLGEGSSDQNTYQNTDRNKFRSQPKTPNRGSNTGTTSSLMNDVSRGSKAKCAFCNGDHNPETCTKFLTANHRKQQVRGSCWRCLKNTHKSWECNAVGRCYHCNANGHHYSLCPSQYPDDDQGKSPNSPNMRQGFSTNRSPPHHNTAEGLNADAQEFSPKTSLLGHGGRVHMQTGLANVAGGGEQKSERSRIFFDTGCSRTFVNRKLADKLGVAPIREEIVSVASFNATKRKTQTCQVVELDVILPNGSIQKIEANVTDHICCPIMKYPIDLNVHPIVAQIKLAEPLSTGPEFVDIDLLVGNDYYYDFIGTEQIKCPDGLILLSSKLGYIVTGKSFDQDASDHSQLSVLLRLQNPIDDNPTYCLERFWNLEDVGVMEKQDIHDDEAALKSFNDSIVINKGRYSVRWPWKYDNPDLPTNYHLAMGRLKSLLKRIRSDSKVLETYNQTIREQESMGIIEKVSEDRHDGPVHYIPHHCLIRPDKATTKLRIVYDASAKSGKLALSLNECMHRGPVILSDLCGLLMRFRLHKIGLVADIEKAFLQVELQVDQRDVVRFIWLSDPSKPPTPDNIVIFRFCRVPFGVISSPFLLGATILFHLNSVGTPVANTIADNNYVDNVITGAKSTQNAVSVYRESMDIFKGASMNLREWYSNSKELMALVDPQNRGKGDQPKVLGMVWDLGSDSFSCPAPKVATEVLNTKRLMLQCLARMYDPCGLFAPVTVVGKMLLQEIWSLKVGWDDCLSDDITLKWSAFAGELKQVPTLSIPRYIGPSDSTEMPIYQLHCFCDASAKAYGAVVYLRTACANDVFTDIVFSKSRVSPLKMTEKCGNVALTIPKLELMAVFIGAKILKFAEDQLRLPISKSYIWSDSQCVLHWVFQKHISTVFVKNRVKEIRKLAGVDLCFVPGKENPADLSSRGCSFQCLSTSLFWWKGPVWLSQNPELWPSQDSLLTACLACDPQSEPIVILPQPKAPPKETLPDLLLNPVDFSSISALLRRTGWIRRFVGNIRLLICGKHPSVGPLTSNELQDSRLFWLKSIQQIRFPGIFDQSREPEWRQLRRQLCLFVDSIGLIRCRGRLDNSDLPAEANCPILVPKNHPLTDLLILECHRLYYHVGVSQTLSLLRYRYWIPQGRSQVKRVLNGCRICRRVTGGHFQVPDIPPLPSFRVAPDDPFACTGLDYFGPLFIKIGTAESQKVWVCIFTCAVVRAVHLEVITSQSAEQFLLCFRRFVAIYGKPDLVVSDNATQFHASSRALSQLIRKNVEIASYSATQGIQWKFIPEMAPWMGGFYERLVGVVKAALKRSLGKQCLGLTELQTVMMEVSAVVNSRPLTYCSNDVMDNPLTPADFLSRRSRPGFPSFQFSDDYSPKETTSDILIQSWVKREAILNSFWKSWSNEYLLSLRERFRSVKVRGVSSLEPLVGSVVLVKDNLPRAQWKIGRIKSLIKGSDGYCRSAVVLMPNRKQITRPLKLLYPIEIQNELVQSEPESISSQPSQRPTRRAAANAKALIRQIAESNLENSQ